MRDAYTLDGEVARIIIKQQKLKMSDLSRKVGYSKGWLDHALIQGRLHKDDFKALKEMGVDLEKAVIKRPESKLINTNIGTIIRTLNLIHKGYPVWVAADVEQISPDRVKAYEYTWEQTRFGLTKKDIEEFLRNWEDDN